VYPIAVVGHWISNRYLADRWWPGTWLLFAPRWPWFVIGLVLIYLARRHLRLWILLIVTEVFLLGPMMGFNIPWHRITAAPAAGQTIRLVTCNVHRIELEVSSLDAYILQTRPDVVALQDYSGWDQSDVLRAGWNTRRLREIFIASRFPIIRAESLNLESISGKDDLDVPRYVGSAACFDLQTPGGVVYVLNIHLASPHTGLTAFVTHPIAGITKLNNNAVRRINETNAVTQYVAGLKGPVILTGDFNMLSESPTFRSSFGQFPDAFKTTGWGYGYTHYTGVSQLRLDHVLYDSSFECAVCQIGPNCGTPHRPMAVDLVLRAGR